eukprot:19850-Eustigmatos_ZCMA.PRE.1
MGTESYSSTAPTPFLFLDDPSTDLRLMVSCTMVHKRPHVTHVKPISAHLIAMRVSRHAEAGTMLTSESQSLL